MALIPGTKFGPFEIVAPLGAGGMGEVYRARDTKLGRDVALKLLPPLFTADADRVARFEREARLLTRRHSPNPHLRRWTIPVNLPIAGPNWLPGPPVGMPLYPRSGFFPEPVSDRKST